MNIFLEIVGWIILLVATLFASLKGQVTLKGVVFKNEIYEKDFTLSIWFDLFVVGLAVLTKIFVISNIWFTVVIWVILGYLLGFIAAYIYWRVTTPEELRIMQSKKVIKIPPRE